jgi:hypothetical protein
MVNENLKASGELQIILRDQYGNIKDQKVVPNMIVTTGRNFIASSMLKTTTNSPAAMTHMGIGTSSTAVALGDTALITAIGTRATVTPSVSNNVVTFSATFAAGNGTGAITEAGVFNASSAGTMLCRTVFSAVNKDVNDSLTINWNITISSS